MGQYAIPDVLRDLRGRTDVDIHTKKIPQGLLETGKREQGDTLSRIHQKVDVAALPIGAMRYGTEHPHVMDSVCTGDFEHAIAVRSERGRGLRHGVRLGLDSSFRPS